MTVVQDVLDIKEPTKISDSIFENINDTSINSSWWEQLGSTYCDKSDWTQVRELLKGENSVKNIRLFRSISLVLVDLITLLILSALAFYLANVLSPYFHGTDSKLQLPSTATVKFTMLGLPVILVIFLSYNANHYQLFKPLWSEFREFLRLATWAIGSVSIVLFLVKGHFSRIWFVNFWIMMMLLVPVARYMCKLVLIKTGYWFLPVVIVGTGENAQRISEAIERNKWLGMKVKAFVSTGKVNSIKIRVPKDKIVGNLHDNRFYMLKYSKPHFIFAHESQNEFEECKVLLNHINNTSKAVTIVPPFYGLPLGGAELLEIPHSESLALRLHNNLGKVQNIIVKRLFDAAISLLLLVIFFPLLLFISLLVKSDGGSIIYRQERIGKNNQIFACLKFRTMCLNADLVLADYLSKNPDAQLEWERDHKLKNDPRITKVGRFLRKTSLDELPQLINVLKNDMSLVGPRPIVMSEMIKYGRYLPYYLNSRPGITGLWQTSGRSDTTYDERISLDVWYARNWSFWLDIVILTKTIPTVFERNGAY